MTRLARYVLLAAGLVVTLLVAADTLAWWMLTGRIMEGAEQWRRDRLAEGYVVTSGPAARAGWPLRAEVVIPDVVLATDLPGQPDAGVWRMGAVGLAYAPWRPSEVTVELEGDQSIQAGQTQPFRVSANELSIVVPLTEAGQAQGVVVAGRGLKGDLDAGPVEIGSLWLRLQQSSAQVAVAQLSLPIKQLPFGGTIGSIELQAHTSAPLPPLRDVAAAATAWRDGGGQLDLSDVALRWGPLDIAGRATMKLDRDLQPDGAGQLRVVGYTEIVDALARSGAITKGDARVAGTLLALVSRPGENGVQEADLPVSLHGRILSVGALPLLKLPPLALP